MVNLKKGLLGILVVMAGLLAGCGKNQQEMATVAFAPPKDLVVQETVEISEENITRIGIIQSKADASMTEIYEGFMEELEKSGFIVSNSVVFDYAVAESKEDCMVAADRMVTSGSAVILAIGEDAAVAAKNRTQDIPIILTGVEDLEESGFVRTNQAPGKNISGVSSKIKESVQVELILELFPKTSRILVMYSANVDSRMAVDEFTATCVSKGIKVNYEQISNADDIRKTLIKNMDSTEKNTIDAVYCPMDDIIFSNMADTAGVCNDNKIPFFCNGKDMVTYGSFATAIAKNTSMGAKAATMVMKAVETPSAVATMPVTFLTLEDCKVVFNETTAKIIEYEIPESYR